MRLDCEWCPADDLIDEARQALGPRLAGSAASWFRLPPDAVVWCDARLVEQVLVNLLDNALRHTPAAVHDPDQRRAGTTASGG